jgi:cell wall-associated NlpC family hydrolase
LTVYGGREVRVGWIRTWNDAMVPGFGETPRPAGVPEYGPSRRTRGSAKRLTPGYVRATPSGGCSGRPTGSPLPVVGVVLVVFGACATQIPSEGRRAAVPVCEEGQHVTEGAAETESLPKPETVKSAAGPTARPGSAPVERHKPPPLSPAAPDIARAARYFLKRGELKWGGRRYSAKCTSLVQAIYDKLDWQGVRLSGSVGDLHAGCLARSWLVDTPEPGDLVFFDNTWDANRNGELDDPLTHVGVVVALTPDGRVRYVHVGSRRLREGVLHPDRPAEALGPDGTEWNSHARRKSSRDPGGTRYLAGELLRGYCRLGR